MRKHRHWSRLTLLASTILCAAGAAHAQLAPSDAAPTALEEVIVTAQKRSENLQDVPISVVALQGDQLVAAGASTVDALQQYAPGLNVANVNSGFSSYTYVRGSGTNQVNGGADPSVAYFVDEVYIGGKSGLQFDLLDVQGVEVLRGPQGTLFGRNAAAGAISITTRRPSADFEGYLNTRVGNYDALSVRGGVSGPIIEGGDLLYRLSAGYRRRDGFTKDVRTGKRVDDVDTFVARGQLEWRREDLSVLLTLDGLTSDNGPGAQTISSGSPLGVLSVAAAAGWPEPGEGEYRQAYTIPGSQKQDILALTARVEWDLGFASLTSISGLRSNKFDLLQDNDGTSFNSLILDYRAKDETFSQELRLAGDAERLRWLVGLYYYFADSAEDFTLQAGPAFPSPVLVGRSIIDNNDFMTQSYAAFGQLEFDVTDALSLTVGGRYTEEKKSNVRVHSISGFPGFPFTVSPSEVWNAFTPAVTVKYEFTPDILGYASYREGFKSGGFQTLIPAGPAVASTPFDPEKVKSYELGLKSAWFGNRLIVNAALFRADVKDQQIARVIAPAVTTIDNAGETRAVGLDLSIAARPASRLQLNADMTFQRAKFERYDNPAGPDYDGKHQLRSPRFSGSFSAEYDFGLPQGELTARAEYNYRTKFHHDPANPLGRGLYTPAYGLANARLTYAPTDGNWEAGLWVNNIFDKYYLPSISISGPTGLALPGEPRTFGATFNLRFD